MKRILVLLLLLILLIGGPPDVPEPPLRNGTFSVGPVPIWVSIDQAAHGYGPLQLYGVWDLESASSPAFGGISSLFVRPDGQFMALNDSGQWFNFGVGPQAGDGHLGSLPRFPRESSEPLWNWDTESMARDPVSGRIWVGFERVARICRYSADFTQVEGCARPAAMAGWPEDGGAESLVRFSDGRFMAIEEVATQPQGVHDVLLWPGDPVEKGAKPPVHLGYVAPDGYRPTDALWLGGDRLLVLNRRLGLLGSFTAKLVMVRLPRLVAGATLRGTVIADFDSSGPIDNLEAMALSKDVNGDILWIASDDNHFFMEKTLLYRLSLPNGWVTNRPAP